MAEPADRGTAGRRPPCAVVVMGVSGCGKSTVARACAQRLGAAMVEGDDFHTPQSIAKMHAGTPLTDADRAEWLQRLAGILRRHCASVGREAGDALFLTCSALRRDYRDLLREACPGLGFVFLELDVEEALRRAGARQGHFFPAALVRSQFETLESPRSEDGVLTVDATLPVEILSEQVAGWLGGERRGTGADG